MKKTISFLFIFISLLIVVLIGIGVYLLKKNTINKNIEITLESSLNTEEAFKIINNYNSFSTSESFFIPFFCKLKRFKTVKAGHYHFSKGASLNEVITILRANRQTPIKLTFNNTRTIEDFAGKIAKQIQPDSLTLLNFLRKEEVANSYGFDRANFIGMFLPNTYEVYYTISPKGFTDRMYEEYERFWNAKRRQKAKETGYTLQQISSLAAIVDEETNKNDEKARIAGVYLNRLSRGIPLQADPTLKFAAGDFSIKRVLNVHKEIDSPYNTYKYAGLPPSPIRQPSTAAIDAVLNAEKHDYLYFCAKADFSGYHTFAKTLSQHNQNAEAYHRELNKRGIK